MNKILVIAKREYSAAVRTKGFLVSLLLLPLFMGGGLLVFTLLKDKVDLSDKRIVVIDYSGLLSEHLISVAEYRNTVKYPIVQLQGVLHILIMKSITYTPAKGLTTHWNYIHGSAIVIFRGHINLIEVKQSVVVNISCIISH